jgi:hypothetical protein
MATTYTLISSNVLASSAASVTFSSIPADYTDLVLRISARCADTGTFAGLKFTLNSDTSSVYSFTVLYGSGSSALSDKDSALANARAKFTVDANDATANTFGNLEIYIPSYLASQNKPISAFGVTETNASAAYMGASAILWRNTAAITSIQMSEQFDTNLLTGSSFYLYGISNA